ncbi:MAG: heavy metal-responsive transcriptional regulator [Blastocatellia bacterium]
MRIGEVAAQAGISVQTVRFYERRGLLKQAERLSSGYRVYYGETVEALRFIKRSQELGYSLGEIGQLLRLREPDGKNAEQVRALADEKVRRLDEQIARLQQMRGDLLNWLENCTCGEADATRCPSLEKLNHIT